MYLHKDLFDFWIFLYDIDPFDAFNLPIWFRHLITIYVETNLIWHVDNNLVNKIQWCINVLARSKDIFYIEIYQNLFI